MLANLAFLRLGKIQIPRDHKLGVSRLSSVALQDHTVACEM